jgi:hypothetical protein
MLLLLTLLLLLLVVVVEGGCCCCGNGGGKIITQRETVGRVGASKTQESGSQPLLVLSPLRAITTLLGTEGRREKSFTYSSSC